MPYLPSSANAAKTTFDSVRQARESTASRNRERAQNPNIAPKFAQKVANESRQSTLQQRAQRSQNPIIPVRTTQQINAERNRAASEQRSAMRQRINQSRNG